jgi:hypothetical protein
MSTAQAIEAPTLADIEITAAGIVAAGLMLAGDHLNARRWDHLAATLSGLRIVAEHQVELAKVAP